MLSSHPPPDLSDSVLKRTLDADTQLLSHYLPLSSTLADVSCVGRAYREALTGVGQQYQTSATAITSWINTLTHERTWAKHQRIKRKADDSTLVLESLPLHVTARARLLKCLQRESHFLVNNIDPHQHIMHQRSTLVQRQLIAFERMVKREEVASILGGASGDVDSNGQFPRRLVEEKPNETATDKASFIELLFARSLEEFDYDPSNPIQFTSFISPDEFVGQLFSILTENLPSQPTLEEELEAIEQGQSPTPDEDDTKPLPVSVFGLTGLMGMQVYPPSFLAAKAEEAAADPNEPTPNAGEDDAAFAARLDAYTRDRRAERKKKQDRVDALKKKKREEREQKAKLKEAKEKQSKVRTKDPSALAAAAIEADNLAQRDPDSFLPPEARFTSMQMLELALDESQARTIDIIQTATKEFKQFKEKETNATGTTEKEPADESSDASTAAAPSIYPLAPLPVTHLLYFLFRDLMRKALLCTHKDQSTIRQFHYVLKRLFDASIDLLDAASEFIKLNSEPEWSAFEKTIIYETIGAGSIQSLFASCVMPPSSAPNAPPVNAKSGSAAPTSSSATSGTPPAPLATYSSPHAPLAASILSNSLLAQLGLPALTYIWTILFKAGMVDDINRTQTVIRGTAENPATEEEVQPVAEEEEKKEQQLASPDAPTSVSPNTTGPTFNLFKVLLTLLTKLDELNDSLPTTAGEERLYGLVSDAPMLQSAGNHLSVVVETPHTYFSDTTDQQVVHIPGASYLVVEFDPRCSSEKGRDHLTITVPVEDASARLGLSMPQPPQKVAGPFHGHRDAWPKMPIVIQNTSTLVFTFHSDAAHNSSTYFGYRALVTGYSHLHELVPPPVGTSDVEEIDMETKTVYSSILQPVTPRTAKSPLAPTRPWYFLFDLQQTLAHVIGRIIRKEVIGATPTTAGAAKEAATNTNESGAIKSADDEAILNKYLSSPLFYNEDAEEGAEEPDSIADESAVDSDSVADVDSADLKRARDEEHDFETKFLTDLIDAKPGTTGFQLDALFKKQLQSKRVDALGGPVTKKVVRMFIATMVKHLGLAKMAAFYMIHKGIPVDGVQLPHPNTSTEKQPATISSVLAPPSVPASPSVTVTVAPQTDSDWSALGDHLLDIWRKGQTMHQYIVSGKQLAQQALDNLIADEEARAKAKAATTEPQATSTSSPPPAAPAAAAAAASSSSSSSVGPTSSASPAPSDAEVRLAQLARSNAEKLATYEGYTENMFEKCQYLLTLPSFSHHPLSTFADMASHAETATPSLDIATEAMGVITQAHQQHQPDQTMQSFKALINLYHTAHNLTLFKEQQHAMRQTTNHYFHSLTDLISTFLRDEVPLSTIRRIRQKQVDRATRRAAGMQQLLTLLKTIRLRSSHLALLKTFGPPFRQYVAYPLGPEDDPQNLVGGHYYNNIEASGQKYRQRVHDAFNRLYTYLIHQLKQNQADPDCASIGFKSLVLDSLCIDWHATVRENSWLMKHQLLSILDEIIQSTRSVGFDATIQEAEPTPYQELAKNLYKFISINCLNTHTRQAIKAKKARADAPTEEKTEEKAITPAVEEEKSTNADGDEGKRDDTPSSSASPPPVAPPPDPFAFLTSASPSNSAPLDPLQRSVLDRLVASLQHSASLLSSLRKSGGESIIDSEIIDISLTPEQRHLLFRRKNRPSASAATSSASAQERLENAMAGFIAPSEDDAVGGDEDDLDIDSYGDAHPSFPLIRRYIYLEQHSFETLALLSSISSAAHHRSYLEYLCSVPVLRTFLLVFVSGSPRMQSIAIRLLAKIMPLITAFQLRDNALYEYLVRADKDERLGPIKKQADPTLTPNAANTSASSTPFSQALKQSYEPPTALDTLSLGESMPQPQTLALSRSSSLQARIETDALLSGDDFAREQMLDHAEGGKFIAFLFKKLAELLIGTTVQEESNASLRPATPLTSASSTTAIPTSTSQSNLSGSKQKNMNPLEYRDGQMKLVLAAELIFLIRTLHKHTTLESAGTGAAPLVNTDWSTSIHSFLTSHLLSLSKLVSPDEPRIASSALKADVGLTLACLSVIGGHTEVLRVGGLVHTNKKSGSKEYGILLALDRRANRCKVIFHHAPNKVIDCDLTKVVAVDALPPDATLVTLNSDLLTAFQVFTRALSEEENQRIAAEAEFDRKRKAKAEMQELERLQKQFEAEEAKLLDPFGGFRDELSAFWPCPQCTFENPIVKPSCELCGFTNPNFFIKQSVVEEEVDVDDEIANQLIENRMTLTNEHMLYYQLRSKALKALCVLLQNPKSMLLLFESRTSTVSQSMMPALVGMAVRPTHLDVFKSIETLEEVENRLTELINESAIGLTQDTIRFNKKNQGSQLTFSPFKNMQLHLPSNLDVGSARSISFVGDRDSLCEVRYNGSSAGLSVGLIRANFLVPNSLPAFYFEVTIHSAGQPLVHATASGTPRSGTNSPSMTPQLIRKSSPVLRALASPGRAGIAGLPAPPVLGGSSSSSGSSVPSSAFDIAIGLFRCGMPMEGLPGRHSTYAYSGRNGELHLTRSKMVVREKIFPSFKAGDTVGCGVHVRYGQRTIFFTLNGKLLHAQQPSPEEEFESLDLGPNAFNSSSAKSTGITSISGIDANLSGRFYPCVWLENSGAHISCNFGQSRYKYDFANEVLDASYRAKLAALDVAGDANGGKKLSAVELKRRTMAEDLESMMGNFPIDLCVLALERNNDDMAAAGDWLFSSGQKALEQMAADALRAQEEKKRGNRGGGGDDGASSGEDEDLADFLIGGDASHAHGGRENRSRENTQNFLDDEVDVDIPIGLDLAPRQQQQSVSAAGGRISAELMAQRDRARQILQMRGRGGVGDQDLEHLVAQLSGLGGGGVEEDLSAATEPIIYENCKLDEIEPGQTLLVAPSAVRLTANAHGWMSSFAGRTGVVTSLNINAALVTLIFHDTAAAIKRCASFPVTVLQKPQRMWQDPCRDMWEKAAEAKKEATADKNISWQELAHEYVSIEKALSVQQVRRAVLRCIAMWPRSIPFDVQHLNGPSGVMAILKLTAAQFLSSSNKRPGQVDSNDANKVNLLEAFKLKLIQLVQTENDRLASLAAADHKDHTLAPPLRITEKIYSDPAESKSKPEDTKSESLRIPTGSASSVKSSSSAHASQQGYSSASANESEYSDRDDDFASQVSSRRRAFGSSERVDEGDGDDDEDDHHEDDHDDDDGYDDEEDPDGGEYDDGEYEDEMGSRLEFVEMLRSDPQEARSQILNMLSRGVDGGSGFLNFGGSSSSRAYLGRSSAPPQPMRSHKKKKKDDSTAAHHASIDEKLQQQLQQSRSHGSSVSPASSALYDSLVTPLLVEECILHFVQSVNHGPPLKTVRSAHPYPSHTEKRGKVSIGGASKLLVRFDPRTQIGTDLMTRLSFYRDQNYQDLILTVQGSGPAPDHCFPPFIVDSDRLYYKFTSGTNSHLWGFKIKIEPIDLRIDDKGALLGRNFELSGWLLDLFLTHFPSVFQYGYITELYNAVVWYVIHSKPSTKSRGVEILVRLLFHLRTLMQQSAKSTSVNAQPAASVSASVTPAVRGSALGKLAGLKKDVTAPPTSPSPPTSSSSSTAIQPTDSTSLSPYTLAAIPDFNKLHPLAQQMDSVLDSMGLSGSAGHQLARHHQRSLQSPTMMSLVELLSTVDLISNEFELYNSPSKDTNTIVATIDKDAKDSAASNHDSNTIDLFYQYHDRLRIDKAMLHFHTSPQDQSTGGRPPKDITAELDRYLGWQHHLQLFIPTDPNVLKTMPGFEGEVSASTVASASASASASGSAASSGPKKAGFHKLHLTYSILTPVWNSTTRQLDMKVAKTTSKSISLLANSKPTLIKPHSSRFENVVNMSRLTLEMKNATKSNGAAVPPRLPNEFLLEAYRNFHVQRTFMQIVGDRIHEHVPGSPRLMRPSPSQGVHHGTRSYSTTFWVYLNSNAIPTAKDAHFRYILHAGNMPDQNPANLNRGMVWPTSGFSIGLGWKDQLLHTTFYEPSGTNPIRTRSRSPLLPKRWTLITMVVTDGIDLNLYIDGSIEITHKFPVPLPALTTDPFFVGTLPAGMMKLYRHQNRVASPENPLIEDPHRIGLGFAGAIRDMRFYSYDIDPKTFLPAVMEKVKKFDKERSNLRGFHVPVDQPLTVTKKEIEEVVGAAAPTPSASLTHTPAPANIVWTATMDIALIDLFTTIVTDIRNKRPQDQPDEEDDENPRPIRESYVHLLDLSLNSKAVIAAFKEPKILQSANTLAHIPHDLLKQRFAIIQLLNSKLIDVLPFVDFTQSLNPWSLAHRLSSISWLILLEVKSKAWKSILTSTASGQPVNLTVNRPRALKARERGNDPDGLKSIFGQTFQQLHFLRPAQLRIQAGNRPFRVKFAGEGGIDAGGPFRDLCSEACSTVQSRDTPLFIPSPNAAGFGDYGNTFIPNPKSTSSLHLSMYAFLGKFMGMAIRGGHVLNLDFPPMVWRGIVAMPITRDDIQDINALAFKVLEQYGSTAIDKSAFEQMPTQKFTTITSDGREVELKENGANLVVTFDNRMEYVRLEEQYRLHEFDTAIGSIRRGLGTIIPVHLLSLFTPSEVETMVCGAREVDIEFLKRHTEYQRGIRPTDPHVRFMWQALEEMTQKERQLFIRFVSGQSRLWSDDAAFVQKFKLMPSPVDNDVILPVSHTCFFSLELPKYSSLEVMRAKLLYAAENCTMIDADTAADNLDWNEE